MCILILGMGGSRPSKAQLREACDANPDGFGWALMVRAGSSFRVVSCRTMNAGEAITGYGREMEAHRGRVVASIFHARIATHGAVNVENCHPFAVGDGSGAVLAHNGVLPVRLAKGDARSDTRKFAEDVLPLFGGVRVLGDPDGFAVLDDYVTENYSKVAILDPTTGAVHLLGESLGHWGRESHDSRVWFSNSSYRPVMVSKPATYSSYTYGAPKAVHGRYVGPLELLGDGGESVEVEASRFPDVGESERVLSSLIDDEGARRVAWDMLTRCQWCDTFRRPSDDGVSCRVCGSCQVCGHVLDGARAMCGQCGSDGIDWARQVASDLELDNVENSRPSGWVGP